MTSFLSLLQPLTEPTVTHESWPSDTAPPPPSVSEDLAAQARQAREEAQDTLARAQAEAETIREDAQIQAEALREAAWQEGFHEGQQMARTQVEADLRAQGQAEREAYRADIETIIHDITASRQALWEAQEAEMVAFVLDIAKQVTKTEIAQNPEVITNVLHNALRRVTDKDHVRIRVSLGDAAQVRGTRDDLMSLLDGIKNLEIVDDRRVGDGGCVIETNAGTIDAKIETQLSEVERALSHAIAG